MINRVSQKEALLFELILWQPEQISKIKFFRLGEELTLVYYILIFMRYIKCYEHY